MTDINLEGNTNSLPPNLSISLIPFEVQLKNVVPVEISAKRFPVDIASETSVNIQMNIVELSVDPENKQAHTMWEVSLGPTIEPQSFEIFIRIIGFFSYTAEYSISDVEKYLQQGSLIAIQPFIRELILSLSTRLQIPPIMLPITKLAHPTEAESSIDK